MKPSIIAATLTAMACVLFSSVASAGDVKLIEDNVGISKILHSIPTIKGDMGNRIAGSGLNVSGIMVRKISRDDVAEDPLHVTLGDEELTIYTKGEAENPPCTVLGTAQIIKRGRRYIPETRTAAWLLTGTCDLPD